MPAEENAQIDNLCAREGSLWSQSSPSKLISKSFVVFAIYLLDLVSDIRWDVKLAMMIAKVAFKLDGKVVFLHQRIKLACQILIVQHLLTILSLPIGPKHVFHLWQEVAVKLKRMLNDLWQRLRHVAAENIQVACVSFVSKLAHQPLCRVSHHTESGALRVVFVQPLIK